MTKDQTINYAIDNLLDNGAFIAVVNGKTLNRYTPAVKQTLSELYDKVVDANGSCSIRDLVKKYTNHQAMLERKAKKLDKKRK